MNWPQPAGKDSPCRTCAPRGLDQMPRIYVASPPDVAARLRAARGGLGHTILWEDHQYGPKGAAAGTVERLPFEWRLTKDRMDQLVLVLGLSRCPP
jgi:hypothetical protein